MVDDCCTIISNRGIYIYLRTMTGYGQLLYIGRNDVSLHGLSEFCEILWCMKLNGDFHPWKITI
jgi:hypothetical protein